MALLSELVNIYFFPESWKKRLIIRHLEHLINMKRILDFGHVVKATNVFFVCFIALRPKSTAMVMAGRSAYLTTFFPCQA